MLEEWTGRAKRIPSLKLKTNSKRYMVHAPEPGGNGKARKSHGFSLKVSIMTTFKERLCLGTGSMLGRPGDGRTLTGMIKQC